LLKNEKPRLERGFSNVLFTRCLKTATGAIGTFLAMTIAAVNWAITIWLEWKFGNCSTAFSALPVTLDHWRPLTKTLVVHLYLFQYFARLTLSKKLESCLKKLSLQNTLLN